MAVDCGVEPFMELGRQCFLTEKLGPHTELFMTFWDADWPPEKWQRLEQVGRAAIDQIHSH